MARLSWLRLSCTPALLSKPTISSVCSPAHFSLLASSLKYCHVRSWFSPSAAKEPDSGSMSAILTVSAWAMPMPRFMARASAPSFSVVAYFIASPVLVDSTLNFQPVLAHLMGVAQVVWCTFKHDDPVAHDIEPLRNIESNSQLLLNEQNRHASVAQYPQILGDLFNNLWC